jgi:hypothetical protein
MCLWRNIGKVSFINQYVIISFSAHSLNIETGRYKNIIRPERKCTNCSKGDIEDEKHFIVDCPLYENIRVKFFDKVISPLEQFVHFLSGLIMFLYLPVSMFNE